MTKKIIIVILSVLFMNACKETQKKETVETTSPELINKVDGDIIKSSLTNKDGKTLEMTFNNTKGTATLNFKGEIIKLFTQKPASGIWYKNENYELREKGNNIELKKDGNIAFTHKDDIATSSLKMTI